MSETRITWYFTFGCGQRHPRTRRPLNNHYTTAYGTYGETRERINAIFGNEWAFQYSSADKAGVDRYNLTYVPCVEYSPGELLPPTSHELEYGRWTLETYGDVYCGSDYDLTVPYAASIAELHYMTKRYGIPHDARLKPGVYESAPIVVTWDV